MEDMRVALESEFKKRGGEFPFSIQEVLKKGEGELEMRIKMLRMVEKASWLVVDNYITNPPCK